MGLGALFTNVNSPGHPTPILAIHPRSSERGILAFSREKMKKNKIPPIHPGEILYEEFLKPMEISQNQLGRDLGVSPRRINEIIHGKGA